MQLHPVDIVDEISGEDFKKNYYDLQKPVVIRNLSKEWIAYNKWTWEYFKEVVGDKKVGIYNNVKSDAYTPINKADDYTTFGEYVDMISKGPAAWRIFLFNIFSHAPQLTQDFTWPDHLMKGFVKRVPMLFTGGKGSITHMHFDIDLSHILHTQFIGRKRVLLFPYKEQHKLYRKPFEVLSLADFSNYYDHDKSKLDVNKFPAVQFAQGFDITLEHGDTLFMPGGYWHHMEYLDSGFAMSLRALNNSVTGKLKGVWNLVGMRNIDTLLKKTMPQTWYEWKQKKIYEQADKEMHAA
ncbi:cupin-like domain-containing protein [Deminuibacter soli]|uniref:Transcriptional regulator n=1 Tax=Deminuibacter soli TaxID=2291815 RepID=A0A3E1NRH1_9BACT|nr:cupin-like domain-containing protein [Deminuibacter soli]RFM30424.1 transcriptional regulator [Deminuibacter soli]